MDEYDIQEAFASIEEELIKSMMRNMKRHRVEEINESMEWSMWQAEQLKALEKYKQHNKKVFDKQFTYVNNSIDDLISKARIQGSMDEEIEILEAIKKGFKAPRRLLKNTQTNAEFFKLNDRKLDALIRATKKDLLKAETALLRKANDQYRKIIFSAQVYANSGAGTYEKAIDMATKDFMSAGLNCIEYKNGARVNITSYASMALRTASKRAYLTGEGEKRQEWGISTVIMNKRGASCPKCLPFVGKVFIDDVWSGGKASDGPYPLLSSAIAKGLYHPNCKDSHTTYFEGITQKPQITRKQINKAKDDYLNDQKENYASRQARKYERLAKHSLDPDNIDRYNRKQEQWNKISRIADFKTGNNSTEEYIRTKMSLGNFRATPKDKVVNILREDSREWIKLLNDEEIRAIKKYTFNSGDSKPARFFEKLNSMLRGETEKSDLLEKYADIISNALKKNEFKQDVICYRSLDRDVYKDKKVGSIFREKQFVSTSIVESGALSKPFKVIIYAKKGSKAGYIEEISHFKKQRELLLDRDTIFRVISKKENMIELEVL